MPVERETMDVKMQRRLQEDALGKDIIDECRTQLMMKFRFLDLALWRMDSSRCAWVPAIRWRPTPNACSTIRRARSGGSTNRSRRRCATTCIS